MLRRLKLSNSHFAWLIATLLTLKVVIMLFVTPIYDFNKGSLDTVKLSAIKDYSITLNIDEVEMAQTAFYYLEGRGFVADNSFGRPKFRKEEIYKSALRPKFNIWLHIKGIQIYNAISGNITINDVKQIQIKHPYFTYYGFCISIIKTVVFLASTYFFYLICGFLWEEEKWRRIATVTYILYPSILFFIGGVFDILETISTPLLVIFFYYVLKSIFEKQIKATHIIAASILISIASLLRPHVLMITLFICITVGVVFFLSLIMKKKKYQNTFILLVISGLTLILVHLPILTQNYKDFGKLFLSTQMGLEMFQGHNEFAKGSWQPSLWSEHEQYFSKMYAQEPDFALFDEKEEMDFYQQQAITWIKQHPSKELFLILKKTAIFFMPYDFLNKIINPFSLLVHLAFICFSIYLLMSIVKMQAISPKTLAYILILSVVAGSIFLSILFFVGYRWRYYSEPFMLLAAILFFYEAYKKFPLYQKK